MGTFDDEVEGFFVLLLLGAFELPDFGALVGCFDDEIEGFFVLLMFGAFELLGTCTRVGTFDEDKEGIGDGDFELLAGDIGAFEL